MLESEGQIINMAGLAVQVCVPASWTGREIIAFAERHYPSGTTNGWQLCLEGNPGLLGAPECVPCENCDDKFHVLLEV